MIFLLSGYCTYGELTDKCIPLKLRIKHQIKKRENFAYEADSRDMTLGEYLIRNVDVRNEFASFADLVLDLGYTETPDYEHLIEM